MGLTFARVSLLGDRTVVLVVISEMHLLARVPERSARSPVTSGFVAM